MTAYSQLHNPRYTRRNAADNGNRGRRNHKVVDQLAACGWTKVMFRYEYLLSCGPVIWSLSGSVHDQKWTAIMSVNGATTGDKLTFDYGTSFDALTDRCIDAAANYLNAVIDAERVDNDPAAMDLDFGDIGETDW